MSAVTDSVRVYLEGAVSHLEGQLGLALRLPPYDEDEQETRHEDDGESYDVPHSSAALHC